MYKVCTVIECKNAAFVRELVPFCVPPVAEATSGV